MTKTVGFAATPLFTRIMSAEEYGKYTLYMMWLGAAAVLVSAVFGSGALYGDIRKNTDNKNGVIGASIFTSVVFSFGICTLLYAISHISGLPIEYFPAFLLQTILDAIVGIHLVKMRYSYSYVGVFLLALSECLITNTLSVSLLFAFDGSYAGRIFGMLSGTLIVGLPILMLNAKRSRGDGITDMVAPIMKRSLIHLPAVISVALRSQADKLIIVSTLGEGELAKYSVAHSLGYGVFFIGGALLSAMTPWCLRKISAKENAIIAKMTDMTGDVILAGALFVVALSPELLAFLAPSAYASAIGAVLPIALSSVPSYYCSLITAELEYKDSKREASLSAAVSTLFGILCGAILIRFIGFFGVGLGILFSAVSNFLMLMLLGRGSLSLDGAVRRMSKLLIGLLLGGLMIAASGSLAIRVVMLIPPALLAVRAALGSLKYIKEA